MQGNRTDVLVTGPRKYERFEDVPIEHRGPNWDFVMSRRRGRPRCEAPRVVFKDVEPERYRYVPCNKYTIKGSSWCIWHQPEGTIVRKKHKAAASIKDNNIIVNHKKAENFPLTCNVENQEFPVADFSSPVEIQACRCGAVLIGTEVWSLASIDEWWKKHEGEGHSKIPIEEAIQRRRARYQLLRLGTPGSPFVWNYTKSDHEGHYVGQHSSSVRSSVIVL